MAAQRAKNVSPAGELEHIDRLLIHAQIIDSPGEGLSGRVLIIVREQRASAVSAYHEFFHGDLVVTGSESNAILLIFGGVIHRPGVGIDLGDSDLERAVLAYFVDYVDVFAAQPVSVDDAQPPGGQVHNVFAVWVFEDLGRALRRGGRSEKDRR